MITKPQRQILEEEITRILNDCVSMCADYVTCFDGDEHIYSDVWEGPGPNYYYRDKIMTLINEFLEPEKTVCKGDHSKHFNQWCVQAPIKGNPK